MYRDDPNDPAHGFAEEKDNVRINSPGDWDDEGISFKVGDYYIYDFALDPAKNVQSIVEAGAGPSEEFGTIGLMPTPGQGAVKVNNSTLSWKTGILQPDSYILHFGTKVNPPQIATLTETSYKVKLKDNTVYYWRVDQVKDGKITKGKLWVFTTN
jgi:hypothetical protein